VNRFLSLALILSLAGVVLWMALRPDAAPQRMPEIARFASQGVDSIEIRDHSQIKLQRVESGWQLLIDSDVWRGADDEAVLHLLNDLAAMQPIRVVTRNPDQYEKLKVGLAATKVLLKDRQGKELFEVMIGKQGSDLLSTYIRFAGKAEVLAVDRSLLWQVKRPLEGWQARDVAPVEAAEVEKSHE